MYTDCGNRKLVTNDGNPPYLLQQGEYNCWYAKYNSKDCFLYVANQWGNVFTIRFQFGHWGKPDSSISGVGLGLDGKPMRQWVKMPDFILKNDHPRTRLTTWPDAAHLYD